MDDSARETSPLLESQARNYDGPPSISSSSTQVDALPTTSPNPGGGDDEYEDETTLTFSSEALLIASYGGPLIPTYILQYLFQFLIVFVSAKLSVPELAGVSLGLTTANIFGYAIFEGMSTALDTMCSQACGAKDYPSVGLHVLRFTVFVNLVAVLPVALLWTFSTQILEKVVLDPEIAEHAGTFLRFSAIGLPGYACFEAGKRFAQAQGDFKAGLAVLVSCVPLNLGLTWFFVGPLEMRVAGPALAAAAGNLTRPFLLAAYIRFFEKDLLKCWPEMSEIREKWSSGWADMAKLAFSGALMTLAGWISYELMTFCTNFFGTDSLAAMTFLGTTAQLVWHVSFAASMACTTRIGQLVGKGAILAVHRLTRWYFVAFLLIAVGNCLLALSIVALMRAYLIVDTKVDHIVWTTTPFLLIYVFFDVMVQWINGPVRSFGWQDIGAWSMCVVDYVVAVPLALFLELGPPKMGIRGLWIGLSLGLALVWLVETLFARRRFQKKLHKAKTVFTETE